MYEISYLFDMWKLCDIYMIYIYIMWYIYIYSRWMSLINFIFSDVLLLLNNIIIQTKLYNKIVIVMFII